ncbi:hypothetical protein FPSE_06641 [Fusarium pseudograminearum CS3096]|uniref:Heterokaryon incompatibility domain-containing protein n=1 Tax=Fusarium pseudograminearum (strain CS3096) TaxID=1028729 RepID=K3VG35_FUSPC|nr:hypothetical protein FPSE_06641 [Fusarium pseudograminearum CS3096]EKJ73217.1 hypothetical protein FPSE_06641 [Fusarium pseudograminearum CS3096]KAF0638951.1 hypothetical protein FPSE5266_06641 [Fusarium pseudograminearum]
MDGLDPNTLWTEEVLVVTVPRSGCVPLPRPFPWDAWPHWNTPLHRAIKFSDFETAEFLLQHGANINIYNAVGKTPLHEAIWNRKYDAIRFLLGHKTEMNNFTLGACIRYEDEDTDIHGIAGQLNIQQALSSSDLTSVQLLVQAGADLCPPSQHPWTTLDLALLYGDRRIVEFLLKQGYKLPTGGSTSYQDVYQDSSRDLLRFSRDGNIVPSKDLYEVYCFVLGKVDQVAIIDVDILIKRFFEALRETANDPNGNKHTATCTSCQDFQFEARVIFEIEDYFTFDVDKNEQQLGFTFDLHPSRQHLIDSASNGCAICAIIADALDDHERNPRPAFEPFDSEFGPKSNSVKLQPARSWSLDCIKVSCDELGTEIRLFQVYDSLTSSFEDSYRMDTSTGSSSAMVMAKNWIRICQEHHTECQEVQQMRQRKGILPRRLLHIGTSEIQPQIVHVQDTVPYCALSYCWGVKDFFTTTRDNLVQNMRGIPMESFPAIMKDAIYVVRSLKYEYIWIDALCIVQDDEQDWAHEAGIMGDIYSNAELTISTLISGDCHTGLFQPRSVRISHPVPLNIWQPKTERKANASHALTPQWLEREVKTSGPVHSRGWTLQEQLLSKRILYFGGGMLHFECLHDYVVEANPGGEYRQSANKRADDLQTRRHAKKALQGATNCDSVSSATRWRMQPFELWKQQVREFTRRSLTRATDRQPAFDAISKSLATAVGCNPLCGIWNGDKLFESLCWQTKNCADAPLNLPNIPSWTWLACTGEISFELMSRAGREEVQTSSGATVVSINTEATGLSITLRGTLHRKQRIDDPLLEHWERLYGKKRHRLSVYLDYNMGDDRDVYTFDTLHFPEGPPYKGLGYPRWPNGRVAETLRLLLQRVDSKLNTFRRIGIGKISHRHSKGGPQPDPHEGTIPVPCISHEITQNKWLKTDEETLTDQQFTLV